MASRSTVVCYLLARNECAQEIVEHATNEGRRIAPDDELSALDEASPHGNNSRRGLKLCTSQATEPPSLATLGKDESCDIRLPGQFPSLQCSFTFNTLTGELLVRDHSIANDTQVSEIIHDGKGNLTERDFLMQGHPRECAILLTQPPEEHGQNARRAHKLRIREAKFTVVPGPDQSSSAREERARFARTESPKELPQTSTRSANTPANQSRGAGTVAASLLKKVDLRSLQAGVSKSFISPIDKPAIQYTLIEHLGRGGQGDISKVIDLNSGSYLACKTIRRKQDQPPQHFRDMIQREKNILASRPHAHIIDVVRWQSLDRNQWAECFMPLYECDLSALVNQIRGTQNPDCREPGVLLRTTTARMATQILSALDYLHTDLLPTIHRDVKPSNILVKNGQFVLADFGVAIHDWKAGKGTAGTRRYMAPEVVAGSITTPKADMYAMGITILECLVGLPLEYLEDPERLNKEDKARLGQCAKGLAPMLSSKPRHRPTAAQLLEMFSRASGITLEAGLRSRVEGTVFDRLRSGQPPENHEPPPASSDDQPEPVADPETAAVAVSTMAPQPPDEERGPDQSSREMIAEGASATRPGKRRLTRESTACQFKDAPSTQAQKRRKQSVTPDGTEQGAQPQDSVQGAAEEPSR